MANLEQWMTAVQKFVDGATVLFNTMQTIDEPQDERVAASWPLGYPAQGKSAQGMSSNIWLFANL